MVIDRSQPGNLNDQIANNDRWIVDSRSNGIYDLQKSLMVSHVNLNGVDTNKVILNFTFDSKGLIYNEINKQISYVHLISDLPFMLNTNSDIKIPESNIVLLRNFMGKYFIYYSTSNKYFLIYEWNINKLNLIQKIDNQNEPIDQFQYTLFLKMNKWSDNLISKIDKFTKLLLSKIKPTKINMLNI